jgi:mannose-1-phosphate guanylyltransferase/mannose-6-phosphate isomerase
LKIVILAGGGGTRLFPLSRKNYPKQFLKIENEGTLFTQTVKRFSGLVSSDNIIIVTNQKYKFLIRDELKMCNMTEAHILLEPSPRNTAPAIALAVKYIEDVLKAPENEQIIVAPSDHIIKDKEGIIDTIKKANKPISGGSIVTFGIEPLAPETGYGYIEAGSKTDFGFQVSRFVEKPKPEKAKEYLSTGRFYWNSGIFGFSTATLKKELELNVPMLSTEYKKHTYNELLEKFKELPCESIDYAVIEKATNIVVIPYRKGWTDIGSWDAYYEYKDKDSNGNVSASNARLINTKNSLIHSDNRLITTIDLEDVMIIDTKDVLMVAKKGESQKVKELVDSLNESKEVYDHTKIYRPWGTYEVLNQDKDYKVKKICVYPG